MNTVLTSALLYVRHGYRVFRARPGTKTPAFAGWQREATTDERRCQTWFGRGEFNIGVATCNFAVLDFDDPRLFERFQQSHGSLLTTIVETPRPGFHCYVAGQVRNAQRDGYDIRGAGGFVVGAGSTVGKTYRLLTPLVAISELKPFPEAYRRSTQKVQSQLIEELDPLRRIMYARAWLAKVEPAVMGKRGSDKMFYACCWMFSKFKLTRDQAAGLILEYNARCQPPFSAREIAHKLEDAEKAEAASLRT